jgi:hypothetical protein
VQNAVPQSQLGTATSSSTFFRSIGGAFGVAVFGAIFNNRLAASLPKYLPPFALRAVHGSNISASPAQLDALPAAIHHGYVLAFSDSLHAVFLIGALIALLAFALSWFLKDLPLRGHAYLTADDVMPGGNAPGTPQEDVPAFVELESGGPPPRACRVVGVGQLPSHPTKEGDRREQHLPEGPPPCPA